MEGATLVTLSGCFSSFSCPGCVVQKVNPHKRG